MKTKKQLVEARAHAFARLEDLDTRTRGRTMTPTELDAFEQYRSEVDKLTGAIDALGGPDPATNDLRFRVGDGSGEWRDDRGHGVKVLKPEQRLRSIVREDAPSISFDRVVRGIVTGDWTGVDPETRAMSIGSPSAGGYLVGDALSAQVIDKARNAAAIFRAGALTVPMETNTLKIARITGDPTAAWKVENAAATASDMTLDSVDFTARTLLSIVKASVELVEDADGIDQTIENALAAALALELDRAALRGSGTPPEPRGIRNQTGVTIQSTGVNGLAAAYGAFSSAVQTIRENNGEPNAAIMAPRVAGSLDRLADTTGQPLRPPPSFDGLAKYTKAQLPVNLTQGSSTDASDAYVGQWNELLIGMRTNLTIEVSRQAADTVGSAFSNLQVWIRAYLRADVGLAQPSHFVVITGIRP